MNMEKNTLCLADLEAETAFELPDRQALSCGIYVVYFEDSFNQYVLNDLTLQNAVQICNIASNNNVNFINLIGYNRQRSDGSWFGCSIYQRDDSPSVGGVPSLW